MLAWQVPITVHFDHGSSKRELVDVLELVSWLLVFLEDVQYGSIWITENVREMKGKNEKKWNISLSSINF